MTGDARDPRPGADAPSAGRIDGPMTDPAADPAADQAARQRFMAERRMLESLVCPVTQGPLRFDRERQELVSRSARLAFPVREGIPVMLVSEARRLED